MRFQLGLYQSYSSGVVVFERFTDRARRVMVLTQEEARRLRHNYIGTEHLLLGIIRDSNNVRQGGSIAFSVLKSFGVDLAAVSIQIEETTGRGQSEVFGHIPFTPRAKKALELALREALSMGHGYIGTEHLLLGLMREGEGLAALVLKGVGVEHAAARAKVLQILASHSSLPLSTAQPATTRDSGVVLKELLDIVQGRSGKRLRIIDVDEIKALVKELAGR